MAGMESGTAAHEAAEGCGPWAASGLTTARALVGVPHGEGLHLEADNAGALKALVIVEPCVQHGSYDSREEQAVYRPMGDVSRS